MHGTFHHRKRSEICLCRCRSVCTVFNPTTKSYEGRGCLVPRSTRDAHVRTDKRRFRNSHGVHHSLMGSSHREGLSNRSCHSHRSKLIIIQLKEEIAWLSDSPLASIEAPLSFVNDPREGPRFQFPSQKDLFKPNLGHHALRENQRTNAALLSAEKRYCEIYKIIGGYRHLAGADELVYQLYAEMGRLNQQKEYQWAQQQHSEQQPVVVNTGNCKRSSNQPLLNSHHL